MKASLKWIGQYVKIDDLTAEEIADKLTFAGIESEGIIRLASATNLVIGEILSCEKHPDSDHLHILQVDEGSKYGIHQIVCGAPNARKGLKVIVAREGAVLPEVTIRKSAIRGVESDGMCCALYELGVDKKFLTEAQAGGIEELPQDAEVGREDVLSYLGLDDEIIDLDLLANRPDLYAIANIAREIGCLYRREVTLPAPKARKLAPSDFSVGSLSEKCPQFAVREVHAIQVKPSPRWMQEALRNEGIRSINNIVDIGNYVMLLTGEPVNMYDLDKLPARSLIVRDDYEGVYRAMDGKDYPLVKGDLVVTSNGEPVCLGGVMTSEACAISETTKNIVVESAVFDGARIRHTVNRLGLSSDSSQRFIKGVNPDQAEYVLSLISDLLIELADAESVGESKNYDTLPHEEKKICASLSYINGRLGTSFREEEVVEALTADHMGVKKMGDGRYEILVPHYRIDMDGEADVSEEVIRILGYANVPSVLPRVELALTGLTPAQRKKRAIRSLLRGQGLSEVLTYTLVSEEMSKQFDYLESGGCHRVKNPMTSDHEFVRKHLIPSLLSCASYNLDHQNKDVAIFEISDVDPLNRKDGSHLAAVMVGEKSERGLMERAPYDFYDMKGALEAVMEALGLGHNRYQIVPWSLGGEEMHPGRSAEVRMGKKLIGYLGELHPKELERRGYRNAVVMEFDLAFLLAQKTGQIKASVPPKFPFVERDLAFTVDAALPYESIEREIKRSSSLIKAVSPFDVYQGIHVSSGKKSIAIRLIIGADDRTLKDAEVQEAVEKAILAIKSKFGAELRQ